MYTSAHTTPSSKGSSRTSGSRSTAAEPLSFRHLLRSGPHALTPITISNSADKLPPLIDSVAEDVLQELLKRTASDEVTANGFMLTFFRHLIPPIHFIHMDRYGMGMRSAGSGIDLTMVMVKDGPTWGQLSGVQEHRMWHDKGKEIVDEKKKKKQESSGKKRDIAEDGPSSNQQPMPLKKIKTRPGRSVPSYTAAEEVFGCIKPDYFGYVLTNDSLEDVEPDANLKGKEKESGEDPKSADQIKELSSKSKDLMNMRSRGYSLCPFITGELKPREDQYNEGLSRQLCYQRNAYELAGTWIGLLHIKVRFSRLVMLKSDTIVIETLDRELQGKLQTIPQLWDISNGYSSMPWLMGTPKPFPVDSVLWSTLWNTVLQAARLVSDLPVDRLVERIPLPDSDKVPAWSRLKEMVHSAANPTPLDSAAAVEISRPRRGCCLMSGVLQLPGIAKSLG
uniref:Uncharacterized protein n=1 Tax=Kwoniella pini CBS 10737 TaxID=1296096 RepID=A0A1B9HYL9_9TREE|nr:uncharacterized protein I206_06209 [Kwoniella pini CBS 10737]OCF48341.1 hypothetical protein I206_06209 [Kwoniella pini CBS 10737]